MCEPVGRQELAAVLRPVAALLALGAEREITIIYIYIQAVTKSSAEFVDLFERSKIFYQTLTLLYL